MMMTYRIVGIGEILWDIFSDGPRFGGAPANFACSSAALAKQNADVFMLSAVGDDDLGRQAIESLKKLGVQTSAVQVNQQATGQVNVLLDDKGVASYVFAEDSAWHRLSWNDTLATLASECDAVCFGSLGQRSQCSRETIQKFIATTPESAFRILDVNLRSPFFSDEVLRESLSLANALKLNDDELPVLAALHDFTGSDLKLIEQLARQYQLRVVALTRGADGAVIWTDTNVSEQPGETVKVIDTVGAGDAFTAAMTLGLLNGQDIATINKNAIATASYVCSRPGATMPLPAELLQD